MKTLLALVALIGLTSIQVLAKDAAGAKDYPGIKRITGSEIFSYKFTKFDEFNVAGGRVIYSQESQKIEAKNMTTVEGAHTVIYYRLPDDTSTLEAVRQYQTELETAGYETLFKGKDDDLDDGYGRFSETIFAESGKEGPLKGLHNYSHEDQRYAALKGKGKEGNEIYVTLYAGMISDVGVGVGFEKLIEAYNLKKGTVFLRLDVLETKAMAARMTTVKAEEITSTIDTSGRIAIYGIYFDTDKADIKAESSDSLAEMAKAIMAGTGRYLIVGHTDNQGDLSYNQTLSLKRATAVTVALTSKYSIPADKILPVGVGMAAPVASNNEEPGRAKNRRVEIVKM